MSLANVADLETAIGEWLYRSTDTALSARASDLITLFEADFVTDPDMRTEDMQEISTADITAAAVSLPPDYIDMVLCRVTGMPNGLPDQVLDYVTPNRAAILNATQATSGVSKFFTIAAGQIFITPQQFAPIGSTLELTYNQFTPLAVATGGTNWLLQKYPNLYLYGSLMHAAAYVDDKDTVAFWKSGRDETMAKIARSAMKNKLGGGPMRVGVSTGFRR